MDKFGGTDSEIAGDDENLCVCAMRPRHGLGVVGDGGLAELVGLHGPVKSQSANMLQV
jgi:hypothetical protein